MSAQAVESRAPPPPASVVGLNSIGVAVARLLTVSGIQALSLVDEREVARESDLADGFGSDECGRTRVHLVAEQCHHLNALLDIRLNPGSEAGEVQGQWLFRCDPNCYSFSGPMPAGGSRTIYWLPVDDGILIVGDSSRDQSTYAKAFKSSPIDECNLSPASASVVAGLMVALALDRQNGSPKQSLRFDPERFTVTEVPTS